MTNLKLEMLNNPYQGKLITFSGIDGSGKSSLLELTFNHLKQKNIAVFKYKTPSEEIKNYSYQKEYEQSMYKHREHGLDLFSLCTISLADRFLLLNKKIITHLKNGEYVLCDRYVFTSLVEMAAFRYPENEIDILKQIINRFIRPDVGFFIAASPEIAIKRIRQRKDEAGQYIDFDIFNTSTFLYSKIANENGFHLIENNKPPIQNIFKNIINVLESSF